MKKIILADDDPSMLEVISLILCAKTPAIFPLLLFQPARISVKLQKPQAPIK